MIKIFQDFRSEWASQVKMTESLNAFIKAYEGEIQELKVEIESLEKLEDMPVFRMPNWPTGIATMEIDLGERVFNIPILNQGQRIDSPFRDLIVLSRRNQKLSIRIHTSGNIEVVLWQLKEKTFSWSKTEWQSDQWLDSKDPIALKRLQCFVIFHQFLGETCKKIIELLSQNLQDIKDNIKNNRALVQAVKKSFEPLIPFVVADILNEEGS